MNIKKLFQTVDMTEGDPLQKIVLFAIPMLLGNIAQQLYNTVDSIIVGRFVGDNALAAVGSAGPILNLMLVLFIGISIGVGIMVAQYFGARQREELSRTIGSCIVMTAIASLIVMVVGPLIARPLLRLLNTPESIIGWCQSYLTIKDVQRLLGVSWRAAKKAYTLADDLDDEELGRFRIEPHKVRIKSVLHVTGTNYNLLQKQIKSSQSPAN